MPVLRSNHRRCSVKKVFPKNLANVTEKQDCRERLQYLNQKLIFFQSFSQEVFFFKIKYGCKLRMTANSKVFQAVQKYHSSNSMFYNSVLYPWKEYMKSANYSKVAD